MQRKLSNKTLQGINRLEKITPNFVRKSKEATHRIKQKWDPTLLITIV